jgi:hypothetical protein
LRTSTSARYLSPDPLAEYLGVTRGWVYQRTRVDGPETIPHLKLGKYLRFDVASSEFRHWLEGKLRR